MTDNDKMREAFERDHGPLSDDKDMQKYFARHECAMRWAWQAAQSVPHYDPSTAEVPPPGQPLQKLGEYLSSLLDEDEWATAEQHMLAAWAERNKWVRNADDNLQLARDLVKERDTAIESLERLRNVPEAELERLRKDAERYAVVRDSTYCDVYMHEIYLTDDDLDAVIDAAIAAEGEKK